MPFQKGNPGKPKGIKHHKTRAIEETAARLKCDPFQILCLFAAGDWKALGYDNECYFAEKPDGQVRLGYTIPPDLRMHAAKEACKYLHCQKKAVEVDLKADLNHTDQSQEQEIHALMELYKSMRGGK